MFMLGSFKAPVRVPDSHLFQESSPSECAQGTAMALERLGPRDARRFTSKTTGNASTHRHLELIGQDEQAAAKRLRV
jgi:hypothetical protein